jgi:hypothetical protein
MYFPDRPNCSTETLRIDVKDVVSKIGTATFDAVVGTSSTDIAHGLKEAPAFVVFMPHADARVWRTAAPDSKYIHLAASTSVTCTISVGVA